MIGTIYVYIVAFALPYSPHGDALRSYVGLSPENPHL